MERAMARGEIPPGNPRIKAALVLGMAIRLAFFERQNLLGEGPRRIDDAIWHAAAAVLEG
jgi:hypothetical protein